MTKQSKIAKWLLSYGLKEYYADDNELFLYSKELISKEIGVNKRHIDIYFHNNIGEYVVMIKGKFSGYLCV